MRPFGSAKELERRRLVAFELLKKYSQTEVAQRLGVSHSSVHRWRRMGERGKGALAAKPTPGRPRRLGQAQQRQLVRLLQRGALAHGWATDLWTASRVATVIRRRFGVRYHPDHVYRILVERLGWTAQKPERRARERDEKEIRRWVREEVPRIKKTP